MCNYYVNCHMYWKRFRLKWYFYSLHAVNSALLQQTSKPVQHQNTKVRISDTLSMYYTLNKLVNVIISHVKITPKASDAFEWDAPFSISYVGQFVIL